MRLVVRAGQLLPLHNVPGELTIQCLEGTLDIELAHETVRLNASEMVFLAGSAIHGMKEPKDASALVNLAPKR
jgi:quercetin dioxygenase-like cupin family protein